MKKLLTILAALSVTFAAFAQENTPEMLKKKELFSKTEMFENPAIFSNPQINADLIKEYESAPSSFKDEQLLPIVSCYLSQKDVAKAKSLIDVYCKAVPSNARAIRMAATLSLLSGKTENAVELYKKAIALGDKQSVKFIASAYLMTQKPDEIAPYINDIKELAKTDMEALNICLLYSLRNPSSNDDALLTEVLNQADYESIMKTATADGLSTVLRVYVAKQNVWPAKAGLIPGRAAIAGEVWVLAKQIYSKVLEEDPNNVVGLKGMGVVLYRTGDVMDAAKMMKKAYDLGDKSSVSDGLLLYARSNNNKIYDMFASAAKDVAILPMVRANLVQKSVNDGSLPDVFFLALFGEGSEPLYKDAGVRNLITEGLKKYGEDSRAAKVKSLLDSNKPKEASAAK